MAPIAPMVATDTPPLPLAPGAPDIAPDGAPPALARELIDLLIELAAAIHKHAIYPEGHPLADTAVATLTARLEALLQSRATLALGVARHQLVVDGVATDPASPVLRDLATRLYRREIGAVRIEQGVTAGEVLEMLRVIARDMAAREPPTGEAPAREIAAREPASGAHARARSPGPEQSLTLSAPHVHLAPLAYDQLQLLRAEGAGEAGAAGWGTELWLGLARAALHDPLKQGADAPQGTTAAETPAAETLAVAAPAAETTTGQATAAEVTTAEEADPAAVARAIEAHRDDAGYDRAILDCITQASHRMRAQTGGESAALGRRISQLVASLSPQAIARLLEVGADASGGGDPGPRLLVDGSYALAVDTVVDLTRAAAASATRSVPDSLLALLGKMARHSRSGSAAAARADRAVRENVRQLAADWRSAPERIGLDRWDELAALARLRPGPALHHAHPCEPERVVQMSLELGVLGLATRRAVDAMVDAGRLATLLTLMDEAPQSTALLQTLREHFDVPETVALLLRETPVDGAVLDRFATRLGTPAIEPLLDALGELQDRAVRRRVLDILVRFGVAVAPAAVSRLTGAPWYLQRNLLVLLRRVGGWPADFSPAPYARHPDARVRREALQLVLAIPALREAGLCDALTDADERVVRIALSAAAESCPAAAVPILARRLAAGDLDPALRMLAVRALGACPTPLAGDALARLCLARRRWWRARRLAPTSPTLLAALAALASRSAVGREHPRAAAVLALAASHADAEVRAAGAGADPS